MFRTQTSPDVPPLAASTSSPVSAPETTRKVANQGAESTGPVAPASRDSVSSGVGAGETAPGESQTSFFFLQTLPGLFCSLRAKYP